MALNRDEFEAINEQLMSEMADMLGATVETSPFDPGKPKEPVKRPRWEPWHGVTQKKIFRDQAEVVGACAEKGTGKTFAFADKIIAHCYVGWDALAIIIGNSHRALAEGICAELTGFSLPRWRDGNREPLYNVDDKGALIENPRAGELMDAGIGLEYGGWKADPNNKDLYLKIKKPVRRLEPHPRHRDPVRKNGSGARHQPQCVAVLSRGGDAVRRSGILRLSGRPTESPSPDQRGSTVSFLMQPRRSGSLGP